MDNDEKILDEILIMAKEFAKRINESGMYPGDAGTELNIYAGDRRKLAALLMSLTSQRPVPVASSPLCCFNGWHN